jgi:protein gp37
MTTKIEWAKNADGTQGKTWNPTTGCSKVSPGCKHCYAETMALRLQRMGQERYKDGFAVRCHPEVLAAPLRRGKPTTYFVNSMSDLFHEEIPFEFVDRVYGVMWACLYLGRDAYPGHVFQVLTKRPGRRLEYLSQDRRDRWASWAVHYGGGIDPDMIHDQVRFYKGPHPRIWEGVSVENQATADERIPHLLQTPAAVRFLSMEPLLGEVDDIFRARLCPECGCSDTERTGSPDRASRFCAACGQEWFIDIAYEHVPRLDWIIVGCESGPNARPMNIDWARSIRDQCQAAGVPFFLKQMHVDGKLVKMPLLDGRTWDEMPGVTK